MVVGEFNREDLLKKLEKAFGPIPKGPARERMFYKDPPQTGERRVRVERPAQLAAVIVGYHVPNLGSPDGYVLEVIRALLSEGKSSRLQDVLVREQAIALEASAEYSLTSTDPGLFYVSASVIPEKDPVSVEKALLDELEKLKTAPAGERELERAKNQLEASFVFEQDSLFYQGMTIAGYELFSNWRLVDDYIPSIRKVSAADVMKAANEYFTERNRTVGVLAPIPAAPGQTPPLEVGKPKDHMVQVKRDRR